MTAVTERKAISMAEKGKKRDKSDLGDNFIPPDAGWAWMVCVAAGLSNLMVFPFMKIFGLLFRERLYGLGMTSPEITSIINVNSAISACAGLLNGPLFRRFTYRKVALAGSSFIFVGFILTAYCESFLSYMLSYAILTGFGMGISLSASNMALNTYFRQKRRKAAGMAWAITGLGPIIFPVLVTALVPIYGVKGTVFIFAAFSLNTIVSAMIYQPVKYHAEVSYATTTKTSEVESMLEKQKQQELKLLCKHCQLQGEEKQAESVDEEKINECTCNNLPAVMEEDKSEQKKTILQKIALYFDLDLLRDLRYTNVIIGLTLMDFGELNFSILIPFILHDFKFSESRISVCMSLLAACDIIMRFLTPFITAKIKWDNRTFFVSAVLAITLGRTAVAFTRSYNLMLVWFAWIGFFKGIRMVFWPVIVPGIVPLKRLPAASGLCFLSNGIFSLAAGPLVGFIRDAFNYSVCLHFLNILSVIAAILWGLEAFVRNLNRKRAEEAELKLKLNQKI